MSKKLKTQIDQNDHRIGHLHASAVLVEYADFECPFCAEAAPLMDDLHHEFGSDLCFVYRHYPVVVSHPHANLAALAAEAADQQGKFWSMHHALFRHSGELSREVIYQKARDIKLDMELFELDMMRPDLLDRVKRDLNSGIKNEVTGTPTFYLNGEKFIGELSTLRERIQMLIDESRAQFSL